LSGSSAVPTRSRRPSRVGNPNCHRMWQRTESGRRLGVAALSRRRQARAGSPNSLAIGEKQMEPAESATILALPGVGLAVAGEDTSEIRDDELTGAA